MPHPYPYVPLSTDALITLSRLPSPPNSPHFPSSIPSHRLNLLSCSSSHLYLSHSTTHLAVYKIHRANGPSLIPVASVPLRRNTTVNNSRTLVSPSGKSYLVLTGGQESPPAPATLSILRLPEEGENEQDFWKRAEVAGFVFSFFSAWGLAVDPSGAKVAFSTNSKRIIAVSPEALLSKADDDPPLYPLAFPVAHEDNIPCISYSIDGKLLASASVDATFAIYRVGGGVLYRSKRPLAGSWSEVVGVKKRCWMVCWMDRRRVVTVGERDWVWRETQRQRMWGQLGGGDYGWEGGVRKSLFEGQFFFGERQWGRGGQVYDDFEEWDQDLGIGREEDEGGGMGEAWEGEGMGRVRNFSAEGVPFLIDKRNWVKKKRPTEGEKRINESKDYRLLLVGRQSLLTLYSVQELDSEKESKEVDVQELDSVVLHSRGDLWTSGWCLKAEELGKLGALAVAMTGIGVVLVRVIKGDQGGKDEKLLVEHVFSRKPVGSVFLPWETQMQVIGMCVVERGVGGGDYSVELWAVWQDGMVQCWEIWREGGLINVAVCV